jgi:hypothetical protein
MQSPDQVRTLITHLGTRQELSLAERALGRISLLNQDLDLLIAEIITTAGHQ